MPISKEQWHGIQNELTAPYGCVSFKLPSGELILVNKSFVSENKTALIVWVDGQRNDGWGWTESNVFRPLVKDIWRRKTRKPGASIIRRMTKEKGGKAFLKRKENAFLHEVIEYWVCYFDTAASLVRQFRKIEGLELVVEGVSDAGKE